MTFRFTDILNIIKGTHNEEALKQERDDIMNTLTQDLDQKTRQEIANLQFVQKLFNDGRLKVDHEYVTKTMIFDLIWSTSTQNNAEIISEIKKTITWMIDQGLNLTVKNQRDKTPLGSAIITLSYSADEAIHALKDVIIAMINKGADLSAPLKSAISSLSQSLDAKNIDALKGVIIAMINKGADLSAPLDFAISSLSQPLDAKNIDALKGVIIAMIDKDPSLTTQLESMISILSLSSDAKNIDALKDVIIAMIDKDPSLTTQLESMISSLSLSSDAKNIDALKEEISSLIKPSQEAITNFKSKLLDCKDEDAIKLLKKLMESKEEVKKPYIEKLKSDQYLMWKISNFNFNDESIKTRIDYAFPEDSADLPFYTKAWYNIYYFFAEFLYHLVVEYKGTSEFIFDVTGHSEITDEGSDL